MIDLHLHSEFSTDGYDAPEVFMEKAREKGLKAVSMAEHSNMDSLVRARNKAEELGMEYISGIEMGGELPISDGPAKVDILGYFMNDGAENINRIAERVRMKGHRIREAFLKGLEILGIPVSREMVRSEYPDRFSSWAIRRMLREGGFAAGRHESFVIQEKALEAARRTDPLSGDMREDTIKAKEVIDAIHADGGMALMAHPFWLTKESRGSHPPEAVWNQIKVIRQLGIDGLEAVNHSNDSGYAETVLAYCRDNGLPASGGTDSHGAVGVGAIPIRYSLLQSMKNYRRNLPVWPDS